jgi:molybdate/tungstate transport system substrate-binding protein
MKKRFIFFLSLFFETALFLVGCASLFSGKADETETLIIFHAGSLTVPIQNLTEAFQKEHPNIFFETEAAGSRTTARKISELGREADLMMSADYSVIDTLLVPEYASWNIHFARNEMVLVYTDSSKYADEINSENWYEILTRDEVVYGHSDPNADPCGYRTLMVWQLAETYYNVPGLEERLSTHCPPKNIRPKAVELLALLQSGDMDYAFEYRSVAIQHHLNYVELPPVINLGFPQYAETYQTASVDISGSNPGETVAKVGAPIVYGLTIPLNAPSPDLAAQFVAFILGPEGQRILDESGQPPISPPTFTGEALPQVLDSFFSQ